MTKIFMFLSLCFLSSISFAQNTGLTSHQYNPANKSQIFTSRYPIQPVKSMLYIDKLSFDNEQQFKKNIPITKMNALIDKYTTALRALNQSTQINDITLEITYTKDTQSFNLIPKYKPFEPEIYKQAVQALEKVERPTVDTKLKMVLKGHIVPLKT